mgnify:CR=1 FL=1
MKLYTCPFIETLRNYPSSKVILFDKGKSITAGQLIQSSTTLATALLREGVKKGDKVILAVQPGIEFLEIMYANMMLGTIISIIDPEMGNENYLKKLKQFVPKYAFVDSRILFLAEHPLLNYIALKSNKFIPIFPKVPHCKIFTTGIWLPIFRKHSRISVSHTKPIDEFETINPDEDFLITYTSGTLSEPKGVMHSYRSLKNSLDHLGNLLKVHSNEAVATHLPHFALLGINAGLQVHLWDTNITPKQKLAFIEAHRITTLFGPPSDFVPIINYLKDNNTIMPTCLKNIYLGSAPIFTSFLSKLTPYAPHIKLTCLYGMTENLMTTFQDGNEKLNEIVDGDLVGTPFPNVTVTIAEDHEISIQSDQLFSGYWNTDKTQNIHFTGDLGKIDHKGRLVLIGRKKEMIIRRNFNLYSGLYEPTISKIPGVHESVLLGVFNPEKEDEDVILVIDGEADLNSSMIMKQLLSGNFSIDKEAIPDKIVFMKIPHAGRQNKVDRKQLLINYLD